MDYLNAAPLNVDYAYGPGVLAELAIVMRGDPFTFSDDTFYDMIGGVADAMHMGRIDFEEHDELINEIRSAHDLWLDRVDG